MEIAKFFRILNKNFIMARYQQQMNIALERLDQGLARVHNLVKRGENPKAVHYMENDLKDLFEELQNIINIEPESDNSKVGFLE